MKMSINVVLGLLVFTLLSVPVSGQQTFDLVEPTGDVTATARIEGGQISVQSLAGQRATFSRDRSARSCSVFTTNVGFLLFTARG